MEVGFQMVVSTKQVECPVCGQYTDVHDLGRAGLTPEELLRIRQYIKDGILGKMLTLAEMVSRRIDPNSTSMELTINELLEKKDLRTYLHFRILHLELERQKTNYLNIPGDEKKLRLKQLTGRIRELVKLKANIHKIKNDSKYECSKYKYLKEQKDTFIKNKEKKLNMFLDKSEMHKLQMESTKHIMNERVKAQEDAIIELLHLTSLNIDKTRLKDINYSKELMKQLEPIGYKIVLEIRNDIDTYSAVLYKIDESLTTESFINDTKNTIIWNEIARRTINLH